MSRRFTDRIRYRLERWKVEAQRNRYGLAWFAATAIARIRAELGDKQR